MTTGSIDVRFGDPAATAPTWAEVERLLYDAELYWLTTVRADGRPHTTPLVGVWHEGAFAFCTGTGEQKHVNLEHSPLVTVTTGTNGWRSGTDVVIEGCGGAGHRPRATLAAGRRLAVEVRPGLGLGGRRRGLHRR